MSFVYVAQYFMEVVVTTFLNSFFLNVLLFPAPHGNIILITKWKSVENRIYIKTISIQSPLW